MVKTFRLGDGKLAETGAEQAQVFIYTNPDAKEKSHLITRLLIDEHTLNSSLDPEELGRIEFEADHFAAIIKRPKRYSADDNFLFKVSSVGLFLFSDKLVLVSGEEEFALEGRVFCKMQSVRDVLLRVIFHSVLHFEEHLKVIRKVSDELELEINQALSNKDLLHMFKLEKSLVYYLDAINSNNKVIERLKANALKLGFTQEINEFLDDLIIEGSQCFQQADSYSQVLSSMMDAWASIINNNLNVRLKRLTVVSICIMTPTFVVSLFSMNVPLPLPQSGTMLSFWLVSAMAASSVLALLLVGFYKKL
ncbi:MAG: magnesium transporter CorA family protein [Candidatus Omnitrophica bacterium]|nr:magnesium transporter CorA family protein [Candidatus Omnitrophota bacterium]